MEWNENKMKISAYFYYYDDEDEKYIREAKIHDMFEKKIINTRKEKKEYADVVTDWKKSPPAVIITFGDGSDYYKPLFEMSLEYRKRWIHFQKGQDIVPDYLVNCYYSYITKPREDPLLSVITTTYRSKHRILRPYQSLLKQTYKNWEWVIIDDTDTEKDGKDISEHEEQWNILDKIEKSDMRIRIYKSNRHNGFIGSMKKLACGLCYGEWLIELDHDDEIVPELFQWIVDASKKYKDATFIHSDCTEIYEDKKEPHSYGHYFGYGYGAYYKMVLDNKYQNICLGIPINRATSSHIIGVPNHIRCWKKSFYDQILGHNHYLPVADDYELILRTILNSDCWVRIARLGYIQYRNREGNNFTFKRLQLIQDYVHLFSGRYSNMLNERFEKLTPGYNTPIITPEPIYHHDKIFYPVIDKIFVPGQNDITFSIIIPTCNRGTGLKDTIYSVLNQIYNDWVLYVIGDHCPTLDDVMNEFIVFKDDRIRWWNFEERHGPQICCNYGLYISTTEWVMYLNDDEILVPDYLGTLANIIEKNPDTSYMHTNKLPDNKNIENISRNCFSHRRDLIYQYGLWDKEYYSDFHYLSRYIFHQFDWEIYLATRRDLLLSNVHKPYDLLLNYVRTHTEYYYQKNDNERIMTISHCYKFGTWKFFEYLCHNLPSNILPLYYSLKIQIENARIEKIKTVHIYSIFNLEISIILLIKYLKIIQKPTYMTLHDFQWIFPDNPNPHYKDIDNIIVSDERANEFKELIMNIKKIFAPTLYVKKVYLEKTKKWPDLNQELETKIHIVPNPDYEIYIHNLVIPPIKQQTIKIAFLGNFCNLKGSDKFIGLSTDFRKYNDLDIEYHVFGTINGDVSPGIIYHGEYKNEKEIITKLHENGIHIILFSWGWSETWCYTLTLAIISGIPICYPDIGAFSERMDQYRENERFFRMEKEEDLIHNLQKGIDYCKEKNNIFQYKEIDKIVTHPDYSEIWS